MGAPGILGWGVHLPHWRLDRTSIAPVAGAGGGRGTRAVASYDEDTTTLGVAAARAALRAHEGTAPASLWFSTVAPAYLDRTNATAVHAALQLGADVAAFDAGGSVRSALGALRAGLRMPAPALVVASDLRTGRPGSVDETEGGDGAAAILVGDAADGVLLAELAGWGSATGEVFDRWRAPGESWSRTWEERFGEDRLAALATDAWSRALGYADLRAGDVDRVIVTGTHPRAVSSAGRALGVEPDPLLGEIAGSIGFTGAAHPALVLAAALEESGPGTRIGLVVVSDGAEAMVWRTAPGIAGHHASRPVRDQLAAGAAVPYGRYLAWRGFLPVEPPRRPEPARPSAAAAGRSTPWKFGLVASEAADGTVHLPPTATDARPRPMADATGTVVTWTVDRLAYSPDPPVMFAVVDFDGGGRLPVELTDVAVDEVHAGLTVEMTFRRLFTSGGIHNYFWKARPCRDT